MKVFALRKDIHGLNTHRKPIVLAGFIAMIIGISVGCEQVYTPAVEERFQVSAPSSTEVAELCKQIEQSVKRLEYSDDVAEDFMKVVIGWKDKRGNPVLAVWKKQVLHAKDKYAEGGISKRELSQFEESVIRALSQRIRKDIDYALGFFELSDVIKHRKANCLGFSQSFNVLGNPVGLQVGVVKVLEGATGTLPTDMDHIVSKVELMDGRTVIVDLGVSFVSKPFIFEEQFAQVGNYWDLKNKNNRLAIPLSLQILDIKDIVAGIYVNRGKVCHNLRQYNDALQNYNKAIELNPRDGTAYFNRAIAHFILGRSYKAISDNTKAIELNPKDAGAYCNRGLTHLELGKVEEAREDFLKAVKLNPTMKSRIKRISEKSNLNLELD